MRRHNSKTSAPSEKAAAAPTEEIPKARHDTRTVALVVIALLLALFALRTGAAFFIPLMISIMLTYALSPVVNRLERWRLPRPAGAAIVMALLIAGGAAAIQRAGADAEALLEQLPKAVEKVRLALSASQRAAPGPLEHVKRTATELEKLAGAAAPATPAPPASSQTPPAIDMRSVLLIGTGSVVIALGQLASVLFLTYFLLAAGNLFRRKLVYLAGPPLARQKTMLSILQEIHALNQRYFAVVVFINVTVGVCTGLGLYFLGLEHAELWGLAITVLHTIPYLGAALVAAAVGLAAYLQFGNVEMALLAGGIPVIASIILGIWLQTMLMGRAARMNAASVFISLLFWGMLWGAWGLLLAIPMMVGIKTLCDHIEPLKRYSTLLAPAEPAE